MRKQPLIIDPVRENPQDFIEYIADKPRAIDGNLKGKTTIERTGINRPLLDEYRLKYQRL